MCHDVLMALFVVPFNMLIYSTFFLLKTDFICLLLPMPPLPFNNSLLRVSLKNG